MTICELWKFYHDDTIVSIFDTNGFLIEISEDFSRISEELLNRRISKIRSIDFDNIEITIE